MLYGHVQFLKHLKQGLPKDAHNKKPSVALAEIFPNIAQCPPIVYLDLWPFLSQPLIMAISPEACFQLTQETPQPRDSIFRCAMLPVTRGKDMISMNTSDHRLWRSRLNPGFSSRKLMSGLLILLEEVGIFARQLKAQAGTNKGWGDTFTLYERIISLTFDIIMRIAFHEQTEGPGPILKAMRQLLTHVKSPNLWTKLERLDPSYRRDVAMQNGIIRRQLLPQIESQLVHTDSCENSSNNSKTVLSLALSKFRKENQITSQQGKNTKPSLEFIDIVESQLRLFISAGHDRTAQAICWIFYEINKNPAILTRLREEHDTLSIDTSPTPFRFNLSSGQFCVLIRVPRIHYSTAGALIQTNPTVLHLREDLWHRTTEFLPDRFLATAQEEGHPLRPVKNTWRAFRSELGHTRCIGEELAIMEMKLALILTVWDLDFDFGPHISDNEKFVAPTKVYSEPVSNTTCRMISLDTVDGEHIYISRGRRRWIR
ncbi:hypothetical protein RRF57_009966 [Xylaria bambusicola]|uniref:Cytochrome P450 n=1 Tax=Xylaria bambusicola TaxID=326684 RepID=A0AAN7Z9A5_9PEZI